MIPTNYADERLRRDCEAVFGLIEIPWTDDVAINYPPEMEIE